LTAPRFIASPAPRFPQRRSPRDAKEKSFLHLQKRKNLS
jgi:hypothetical protein